VLAFNASVFWMFGSLVIPFAAYGAATGTGYARRDALAIAAGSGIAVAICGVMSVPVVAYVLVAGVAMRPLNGRTIGFRAVVLTAVVLVTHGSHAWWVVFVIPALVAATDEAVERFRAEPAVDKEPAIEEPLSGEHDDPRRSGHRALMLSSLSCLMFLALPWLSQLHSGVVPGALAWASGAAGAALAFGALREDPARAAAALALSAVPVVVLGWIGLIILGGGLEIGN
jgi:hypothetical protein